jgi:MFS family permease
LSAATDGVTTLVIPVQVDAATDGTGRASALGLVTLVGLLLAMLVQPVAGLASDRLRHHLGRRGWIAVGTAFILLALGLLAVSETLLMIAIAFALTQIAISSTQAGLQGLIPDLVHTKRRGVASGWKGFADVGGATIGFVLLGWLLQEFDVGAAMLATGLLLTFSCVVVLALVREQRPRSDRRPWSGSILTSAYRVDVAADAVLLRLIGSRFVFLLGVFAVGRFFVFFVDERLDLGSGAAGGVLGLLALVTVVASPIAGWAADHVGRLPAMRAGALFGATGVVGMIPARGLGHLVVAGALLGLGSASFSAANWAATSDEAAGDDAARRMALANFGTGGAAAAAGIFGPLIDMANGLTPGMGFTALFLAAALSISASFLLVRGLDEAHPDSPVRSRPGRRRGGSIPPTSADPGGSSPIGTGAERADHSTGVNTSRGMDSGDSTTEVER